MSKVFIVRFHVIQFTRYSVVHRRSSSVRCELLYVSDVKRQEAFIDYEIDEYDERFLRHMALGYTKEMITNLKGMPFSTKTLEKRQNELINRLFTDEERRIGVNATRLIVRALEMRILTLDNLQPDEE